jgi:hypothetical protein
MGICFFINAICGFKTLPDYYSSSCDQLTSLQRSSELSLATSGHHLPCQLLVSQLPSYFVSNTHPTQIPYLVSTFSENRWLVFAKDLQYIPCCWELIGAGDTNMQLLEAKP